MTRLIDQYRGSGKIARRGSRRNRFCRRYTDRDIVLLAATDLAHERLSGPATCRILKREWEVFGKPEHERLAGISPSHLYNLRGGEAYRKRAGVWEKTRCGPILIGERRRPEPHNEPWYLRVDTVHQGDREKRKGVYHINAADAVTQWEIVGRTERISEHYPIPVLEAILHQFPFRIEVFTAITVRSS